MATKRKKKAAAHAEQPATRRKRKPAKRKPAKRKKRKAAASSGSSSGTKRTRKPLQLVLRVEDVPINSPALAKLTDGQRIDLAAMNAKKSFSTRPAWAVDEKKWRAAIRLVSSQWKRLRNPWPTVARVYLLTDGAVGHGRGYLDRESEREEQKPARGRRRSSSSGGSGSSGAMVTRSQYGDDDQDDAEPMHIERLRVDETGVDERGEFRGRGIWWRVWNASIDSVVRAATASAARAIVTGRAH